MKVDELLTEGYRHIHKMEARMLLSDLLGYTPLEILNHLADDVPEDIVQVYRKSIDALLTNKPIQYVLGNVNFYGNRFKVTKNVLIPRFETEELVEQTLHYIQNSRKETLNILDLGCGSGVIGITLKKHLPKSEVTLVDISPAALEVASYNAKELNVEVNLLQSDMFDKVEGIYQVIISNPPYIREDEDIDSIVKDNEPHLALYGGKDGLDSYRKILKQVQAYVDQEYLLAFEIGCDQKEDICRLIKENLKDVTIETKKDLQGRDRMIFVLHNFV